ncbi:hypothetical protein Pan241w_43840 [Gimesia alba]|uniref:DUF1573 domain-containing protein n=1 Tax=Gimesia alba TaxID=2527973 RepID=A0A517RK70_9PLAN|nr:hypothetical protein [Gimesia alba]QDT44276.1 hypothetical protein Pan241w_43840 [Gimesia alba]
MKILSIIYIPILIFFGGGATWFLGGYFGEVLISEQLKDRKPLIKISEQSLTLGKVWEQQRFEHKIWIENLSDQGLNVSLSADCNCTKLSTSRIYIPPKAKKNFIAVFDLIRGDLSNSAQATEPGKFETTIKTTIHSPYFEINNWKINADLLPPIFMNSRSLVIDTSDTTKKEVEIRVPVTTLNEIESIKIENTQEDICTAFIKNYTRHDSDYIITLKPNLTLLAGLYKGMINVYVKPVDRKYFLARSLTYKVNVESDWLVTPDSILLSNLSIDDKRKIVVKIKSKSKSPFKIMKCALKKHFGKNYNIELEHVEQDDSSPHFSVLYFTLYAQSAGVHSGILEVYLKLSNGKERFLKLPFSFSISAHDVILKSS